MAVATKITGQESWDTDAEFRADTLAIHNALKAAGGLVQTADTGQTDHTANTRAAGGYNVYRFDDADQASYPLYLRIDWTPTATVRPGFQFTLGTGSNGSGTITGVIRSATTIAGGSSGSAGSQAADHFVSVGPGYVWVVLGARSGVSPNQVTCIMIIERSTDEDGVTHPDEGVHIFCTPSNSHSWALYPTGFASIGPSSGSPLDVGNSSGFWDDQAGSDVGFMPMPYLMRSKLRFCRGALARQGRVSYGVSFDATHLGATRKLISIEGSWFHSSTSSGWWNGLSTWPPAILLPWN